MKINDVENMLEDVKYHHLTDDVLVSYRDQQLDAISRTQAEVHLNLCLKCERRLSLLEKERVALDNYKASAEDVDLVKRVLQVKAAASIAPAITERFAGYLRQAVESWKAFAMQLEPVRAGGRKRVEIWRLQSGDGRFVAHITHEPNADLTLQFSSSDPEMEGMRLKIKIGVRSREETMQRVSQTEIRAEVVISRRQRPKNLADISFEID